MSLLALDLGTKSGYCFGSGEHHVSGVADFSPDRFSGGGMRFLRFKRWLDELHHTSPITEIVFEEVRGHKGTSAAHVYGGLMAVVTFWAEHNSIPYAGIPVGTIKKFATGKGNAGKQVVVDAVRSWGYAPQDDNEADAIALFRLHALGSPSPPTDPPSQPESSAVPSPPGG